MASDFATFSTVVSILFHRFVAPQRAEIGVVDLARAGRGICPR